jgi:hypothetical protein
VRTSGSCRRRDLPCRCARQLLDGFATNTFWLPQKEGYSYLSPLRAGGIRWIREDFNWALCEVRAVADRYGVRGRFWRLHPRLTPSPVTAIELWNEPWIGEFWESAPDPAVYARLQSSSSSGFVQV